MSEITTEQMLEFLDYIVGRSDKWALGDTIPTTIGKMVAKGPSKFVPPPMTKPDGETMWKAIRSRLSSYDALKAEVERLKKTKWPDIQDSVRELAGTFLARAETAESALAAFRIEAKKRIDSAEAELEQARPLIEAVMKANQRALEMTVHDGTLGANAIITQALAYRAQNRQTVQSENEKAEAEVVRLEDRHHVDMMELRAASKVEAELEQATTALKTAGE